MGDIDEDPYSVPIALLLSSVPTPDADDCALGLETKGGALSFTAEEFQGAWFGCKWQDSTLLYQGGPFHTYGEAVREVFNVWAAGLDCDHDRPSPGDDITRAAFDAVDREGA